MSNNVYGLGQNSPLTNNPFLSNSAASRFPAISGEVSVPQQPQVYTSDRGYQIPQQTQTNYPAQYQPPPQTTPQQHLFPAYGQPMPFGIQPDYQPQPTFQPSHPSTSNIYNGATHSQDPAPHLQTSSPRYADVVDLDPFAPLGQFPGTQPTQSPGAAQPITQSHSPGSLGGASWNNEHPRSFVRDRKGELESWRPEAWKQLKVSVEKLKLAWMDRKNQVMRAVEGYGSHWDPTDAQRAQACLHEAENNINLIVASSFQLEEAEGYHQSRDPTSRSRVREALNAALRALPESPEPLQMTRGGVTANNVQPPLQLAQPQQPYQPVQQLQPSFPEWGGVPAQYWPQQQTYGYPQR